jgi:hypothetical protein
MNITHPPIADNASEQTPARMVAGALAHLATHMETGCPRAAWLAAMLLDKLANDSEADEHLRIHARQLVEILDGDTAGDAPPQRRRVGAAPGARAAR